MPSDLEPCLDLDRLGRTDRLVYNMFMQFKRSNRLARAGQTLGLFALIGYVGNAHGVFAAVTRYLAFAAYALYVLGAFALTGLHARIKRLEAQEDTEMEQEFEDEVHRRIGDRLNGRLRAANAGPDKR